MGAELLLHNLDTSGKILIHDRKVIHFIFNQLQESMLPYVAS